MVGHYDGDTLVVDTIGLNDKTFVDNYRTPHTDKIHAERFRMLDGGKILKRRSRYFRGAFNMPWTGVALAADRPSVQETLARITTVSSATTLFRSEADNQFLNDTSRMKAGGNTVFTAMMTRRSHTSPNCVVLLSTGIEAQPRNTAHCPLSRSAILRPTR
jgi:hypothetical protein